MPGHSVKALLFGVLLVPLAWIGIVLVEKFHARGLLVPVMAVWSLVVIADMGLAVMSALRSRQPESSGRPSLSLGGGE
jgi:hypothetical protein